MEYIEETVIFVQDMIHFLHCVVSNVTEFVPISHVSVDSALNINNVTSIHLNALLPTAAFFLAAVALVFGILLALVAKYFYTKTDPKVEKVSELLAHAHCGACGFPGCHQYAEAVCSNPDVSPALCTPAGKAAALKIANLVGKSVGDPEPKIAFVACRGDSEFSKKKFEHRGVPDCIAAAAVGGGDKECPFGCLGYGSCVVACPFDAIKINSRNLAIVDSKKCVACGLCVKICPRKIISIVTANKKPRVQCYSNDKGAVVKRYCKVGCIGCGLCVKNCPSSAIEMIKNLAKIDNKKCTDCGICETKCPTKAIQRIMC